MAELLFLSADGAAISSTTKSRSNGSYTKAVSYNIEPSAHDTGGLAGTADRFFGRPLLHLIERPRLWEISCSLRAASTSGISSNPLGAGGHTTETIALEASLACRLLLQRLQTDYLILVVMELGY